jgi:hypothetical protein
MASASLKNLVSGPITPQMIAYIAKKAASVIPCDPPPTQLNMPTTQPQNIGDDDQQPLPHLHNFIQRLVTKSNVSTATFLTTIVYLDRLRTKLPKLARGMIFYYFIRSKNFIKHALLQNTAQKSANQISNDRLISSCVDHVMVAVLI